MEERSRRALDAALAVAAEHGLPVDGAVVLRDRANLLLHLRPAPVVARIATQTGTVRRGDAWLTREVAVASFLAGAGAPVVAPSAELPPGPHARDGFAMSFWRFEEETGPVDAAEAGRRLRTCHDLLTGYPGMLPRDAAMSEARALLDGLTDLLGPSGSAAARRRADDLVAGIAALALPVQPVHGDAHLGNALQTARGPLWTDWEDCFAGPRLWDVACLRAFPREGREREVLAAAVHASGEQESAALDLLTEARRFQGTVWSAVLGRARGNDAQVDSAVRALVGAAERG